MKLLDKLFGRPRLVEVRPDRTPLRLDAATVDALVSLPSHPGFAYLAAKLELQAAFLDAKLRGDRHASLREVDLLQSGQFWCRWLQNQIAEATRQTRRLASRTLDDAELEAFRQVDANLERIGARTE